jgi:hypothetical protein
MANHGLETSSEFTIPKPKPQTKNRRYYVARYCSELTVGDAGAALEAPAATFSSIARPPRPGLESRRLIGGANGLGDNKSSMMSSNRPRGSDGKNAGKLCMPRAPLFRCKCAHFCRQVVEIRTRYYSGGGGTHNSWESLDSSSAQRFSASSGAVPFLALTININSR